MKTLKSKSLFRLALDRLLRNKAAMTSLLVLGLIILAALLAPSLRPFEIDEVFWDDIGTAPSLQNGHWFGTDSNGRDLFVRTMFGVRISLLVALCATVVSLVIGVLYGAIAGYVGGAVDHLMMRFVDVLYAMPFMFFVILLMSFFGRNIYLMFVAIGAVEWLTMARIVRGQTLSLRQKEFVLAAEEMGVSRRQIIWRHIIPNTLGLVVIYSTLTIPVVILTESFLSFIGLGVQEPLSSLGVLIDAGAKEMQTAPWTLVFPGSLLAIILFCLNFIGDGLRDALDPKDR